MHKQIPTIIISILTIFILLIVNSIQLNLSEKKHIETKNKTVNSIEAAKLNSQKVEQALDSGEPSGVLNTPITQSQITPSKEPPQTKIQPSVATPSEASIEDQDTLARLNCGPDVDLPTLREELNNDIVSWLRIQALNINIPVVQHTTNDDWYYLSHDIDKNPTANGWVFLTSGSDEIGKSFNTIIYGHNRADNKHFGSLKNLLKQDIQSKGYIEATNFFGQNQVFRIVSICILQDDDLIYIKDIFNSGWVEEEKAEFIEQLRFKNIVPTLNSDDVKTTDNYLTLSTCHESAGENARLVVIAKRI